MDGYKLLSDMGATCNIVIPEVVRNFPQFNETTSIKVIGNKVLSQKYTRISIEGENF